MTDNNTQNATQQQNTTQPEGNGTAGKMFTQEEVNSIVRERLARERAKGQTEAATTPTQDTESNERDQLEAEKEQLAADRRRFENECYCKESGISTDIIDILGDIDPAAFKEKTEKLKKAFSKFGSVAGATGTMNSGAEHGGIGSANA